MTQVLTPEEIVALDGTSPEARDKYQEYGIVFVPSVFSQLEAEKLRNTFTMYAESGDSSMKDFPKGGPAVDILQRYPRLMHPHRHTQTDTGSITLQTMTDDRIQRIVKNLIGPAFGAQSMVYFKPPTARGQALHQDNWFLRASPETCLAVWIALDDADSENGGLHVIPRSHRNDILCHGMSDLSTSFSPNQINLPAGIDAWGMSMETKLTAGDVLFFHGSLVHGSLPNTSNRFRRCLIFHFCSQGSKEIAVNYQPLISPNGREIYIDQAKLGGPCGDIWMSPAVNGASPTTFVA